MRRPRLLLLLCLFCVCTAQAREQTFDIGGLQVTAWLPDAPAAGRQPVLIFSHGLHGCDVQSRFLTQAFAAAGYLVFAPNHRDASCHGGAAPYFDGSELMFLHPEQWSDSSYRDRELDVRRLIAALYDDPRFRDRADWSRLGLVGYSLGGYTMLGMGGAWPDWKLPGVKALLALAPYTQPFAAQQLAALSVPVMYQCGENDFLITPAVAAPTGSYELSPQPKYYVEFAGAGHLAWSDSDDTDHRVILAYSLAFLNHYVKGMPAAPLLTQPLPYVVQLRYASELGSGGTAAAAANAAPSPESR
jgi:predicted dienelactone hydrolase